MFLYALNCNVSERDYTLESICCKERVATKGYSFDSVSGICYSASKAHKNKQNGTKRPQTTDTRYPEERQ